MAGYHHIDEVSWLRFQKMRQCLDILYKELIVIIRKNKLTLKRPENPDCALSACGTVLLRLSTVDSTEATKDAASTSK
ncbi:hypothetical protein D6C87_08378 [Aureobasidium pullulans]|uniref:Uncharacterized protein n=1 Tax=Aureobasidium pullulans TaxID=5580 RepID=A0A4S8W2H7_AURPU|nr:hypothetical protein D6D24_02996 [Aureobasidium pullulans]THX98302.1 hypothetical protein D6D03_07953 [Aureobasidium pullulans]THY73801.1 hypothetical protein D6C94_05557 [Aureobasidium pullulans]THZ37589.1 hypothetical protein D6C87_08378 [Aureobasidium pullulans]